MKFKCNCDKKYYEENGYGTFKDAIPLLIPDEIKIPYNTPEQEIRKCVSIDSCISVEVFNLWKKGIITTGCCCGHNISNPYISVKAEFIDKMIELGYETYPHPIYHDAKDHFYPKSIVDKEKTPQEFLDSGFCPDWVDYIAFDCCNDDVWVYEFKPRRLSVPDGDSYFTEYKWSGKGRHEECVSWLFGDDCIEKYAGKVFKRGG